MGVSLIGATAAMISLIGSSLIGVSFTGSSLTGVSFTGSSLTGSSLIGVSFTGSSFTGTSFTACRWRDLVDGISLIGVSLTGSSFTGVSFTGAPWSAADITVCAGYVPFVGQYAVPKRRHQTPRSRIQESWTFANTSALAGRLPSGLCVRSRSLSVIGGIGGGVGRVSGLTFVGSA